MIDPLEDDGDLAQARHRVRVLEAQLALLLKDVDLLRFSNESLTSAVGQALSDRSAALRLRDASALEHEREAARRREVERLLGMALDWHDRGELHDDPGLPWAEIRAHLRQGETT